MRNPEKVRASIGRLEDGDRAERDRERYAAGNATAASVGAAMAAVTVHGTKSGLAKPLHNEMPLSILETPTGLTFMFHRKFGHWSGHGVRMVDLDRVADAAGHFYTVTGETFMAKPSPPPPPAPASLNLEPVHYVYPHEKELPPSSRARGVINGMIAVFYG